MKKVLVFKTSVQEEREIQELQPALDRLIYQQGRWNFDLEDCDKILRVEAGGISTDMLINILKSAGYYCEELKD
ncbi:hypothetical protein [Negadavirga shengliensis]|uniref:Copper chaperone CopZ n=1 Tax=Negadavirga shengliensis TaxID=1389218 RepID=A0ABV9T4P4_9BACT